MNWYQAAALLAGISLALFIRLVWVERKRQKLKDFNNYVINYNRFLLKLLGHWEKRAREAEERSWNVAEK